MPWDSNKSKMTLMGSMKCLLKKNPRAKYYIEAERLSWGSYTLFPTPPPLPTAYPVPTGSYNVFQVLSTTKRESIGEITTEKPMIHCVASWWARGSSLPATQMEGCIQKAKSLPASDSSHHWIMCAPQVFSRELLEKVNIYFLSLREKTSRPEA